MVVFYQQPNYERFQVASDECTISRKTDSLYRRKLREQSMLHVKRVRVELRIPEGISLRGRCVRRLARPKVNGTRIGNHREIHGWNGSAKTGVRHMAERAGSIPVGRDVFVIIHELAERFDCLG